MSAPSPTPHPGVLHATMSRSGPSTAGQQITGWLVLADDTLAAEVRVGDRPVDVAWGLPSPGLDRSRPDLPDSHHARFVATYPPEVSGRARLLVRDGAGEHEVAACPVPELPGPGRRMPVPAVRARLEELLAGAEAADDEHRRLHRSLAATPVPERDDAWLETLVLLNARFRFQGRGTFAQLEVLRESLGPAAFADVWRRCSAAMHPDTLTQHGFAPALAAWEPERVWAEVAWVARLAADRGHDVFVTSGTLLGLVRDGRPIDHDYDADLVVVVPGDDAGEAVEEFWRLKEQLSDAGRLLEEYESEGRSHARVVSPAGLPVDLFPAWTDPQGRAHVWPTVPGTLPASALLPLTSHRVGEVELPLPRDPEALLALNYGPGWREPDPLFRFDWAEARARFGDFIAADAARRSTSRWPSEQAQD